MMTQLRMKRRPPTPTNRDYNPAIFERKYEKEDRRAIAYIYLEIPFELLTILTASPQFCKDKAAWRRISAAKPNKDNSFELTNLPMVQPIASA